MQQYVITNEAGVILSVFKLVEPHSFTPPLGLLLVPDPNEEGVLAGSWDGEEFHPPGEPPTNVADADRDVQVLFSLLNATNVFLQESWDGVQEIPTKATNAPPAVAASSAAGSVETRFALEDHEHGINASQQSQISALQSNVGSLLTLTGGLNTPAPATATPAADSGSGAVGTSVKFAREDHAHPLPVGAASTVTRRVLGTAWQPSATKMVMVVATVRISVTSTIGGASEAAVELRSDSSNPPTTVRTRAQNRSAVTLAIALQVIDEKTFTLVHLVPAGDRVVLTQSVNTGTNTCTIERVTETVIG
jgi:hypothetical protein